MGLACGVWRPEPKSSARFFWPRDDMLREKRHGAAVASVFVGLSLEFSMPDNPPTRMKRQIVRDRHSVTGRTSPAYWDCARAPMGGHQTSVRWAVDVLPEAAHLAGSIKAKRAVGLPPVDRMKPAIGTAVGALEQGAAILLMVVAAPVGFAVRCTSEIGHSPGMGTTRCPYPSSSARLTIYPAIRVGETLCDSGHPVRGEPGDLV